MRDTSRQLAWRVRLSDRVALDSVRRAGLAFLVALLTVVALSTVAAAGGAGTGGRALLVCNGSVTSCPPGGTYFTTIQDAVNAAQTGDWILIWPGIYHENGNAQAGVYVTTAGIHVRGMDRNRVVVDGTTPGSGPPCPSDPARQVLASGGRNGIEVFKVDGVTVENLTVCNFHADARPGVCFFIAWGNVVAANHLANNGLFDNPTNGDLANEATARPRNCFFGNSDPLGLTSDPPNIQSPAVDGPPCGAAGPGDSGLLKAEIFCAAGVLPCPPGSSYPGPTQIRLLPLISQMSMPDPCDGVPANPWCQTTTR